MPRISPVVQLLRSCGPTHVANLVMAVVVNSIKTQIGSGSGTNMLVEFVKTVEEKLDTATTIVLPTHVLRICASVFGVSKGPKFWCPAVSCGLTVFEKSLPNKVISPASTRLAYASCKAISSYANRLSTRAFTNPICSWFGGMFIVSKDRQPSKRFAGYVASSWSRHHFSKYESIARLISSATLKSSRLDNATSFLNCGSARYRLNSLMCIIYA